jgi:hypothetical protein
MARLRRLFRRLDPSPRVITVGGERRRVVLIVTHDPVGRARVHGRLAPAGPTWVGLLSLATGTERVAAVDRAGRFAFDAVDRGPAQLLIRPTTRAAVVL